MSPPALQIATTPKPPAGAASHRLARIIDAAAEVFAARGYHGASTQDIADRLGIRQASLYYYFASKEAALKLVCERGAEAFAGTAREIAASAMAPREKLAALMASHSAPLRDQGAYVRVFLRERQYLPPQLRRQINRHAREVERSFEDAIREGQPRGEFSADIDPRLATLAILGMLNAAPFWRETQTSGIEEISQTMIAIALQGVCGKPPTQRRR